MMAPVLKIGRLINMQLIGERKSSKARRAATAAKNAARAAGKAISSTAGKGAALAKRGYKPVGVLFSAKRGVLSFGYAGEMAGVGGTFGYLSGVAEGFGIKNQYIHSLILFGVGVLALVMKPRAEKWKQRYTLGGTALMGAAFFNAGRELHRRRYLAAQSAAAAAGAN